MENMLLGMGIGKNRSENTRFESVVVFQMIDNFDIDKCCTVRYSSYMWLEHLKFG